MKRRQRSNVEYHELQRVVTINDNKRYRVIVIKIYAERCRKKWIKQGKEKNISDGHII